MSHVNKTAAVKKKPGVRYTTGKPKDTPPVSGDAPTLPKSVQSYLDNGAPEGMRNKALFDAATQLRDIGQTDAAAYETLAARAVADGLKAGEVRSTIRHAFAAAPRETPRGNGTSAASRQRLVTPKAESCLENVRPAPLPAAQVGNIKAMLLACFKEGEGVCIASTREMEDGRRAPERGVTLTREKWLAKIETKGGIDKCFTTKHGLFLRVNPMRVGGKGEDADVTAFRHVLVEFDKDGNKQDIPKELQYGAFLHSQLPISAVLDSGNKSVHAWVRVDAKNAAEYAERVEHVFALFDAAALDEGNKNPSRFSRCPDGWRHNDAGQVVQQTLLALDMGTKDWDGWLMAYEDKALLAALGEPMRCGELGTFDVANDPNAVLGENRWLCRGGSVIWAAQTGIGKSSLLMSLCVGWGLNRPEITFNIAAKRPLKSLIIQAENDVGDMAEAYQGVRDAHNLTSKERAALDDRLIFYRVTTLSGELFCKAVKVAVRHHKPDICWIDPLLNFFGGNIADAEAVAKFCTQWLNPISRETGVIFSIMTHTGKPKEEGRPNTASDAAYALLGSSALSNWAREVVSIQRKQSKDDPPTFQLTMTKRRLRAGLRDTAGQPTDHIYIRHASDGRIAWEQCEEPKPGPKAKKAAGSAPAARSYTLNRKGAGAKAQALDGVIDAEVAGSPADGTEAPPPASSPPDEGVGKDNAKAKGKRGRPPALNREQKAAALALHEAGILTRPEREKLAIKFDCHERAIRDFIKAATGENPAIPTNKERRS